MRKLAWILFGILGFFVIFAVSAVVTFTVTLDRDKEEPSEEATAAISSGELAAPDSDVIENEATVTRVTPALSVADSIILKTVYLPDKEEDTAGYEMPEVEAIDVLADVEEEIEEEKPVVVEEKKEEVKKETPKTEEKKEAVKAEAPKVEEKKEEVKAEEPKVEEVKEEVKEEEPKVEEKKEEEPKVEEKKEVVLDPNKQYSDTGL